ncbi:MAG TPA: hypothetical protein VEX43_01420 [Chthoniobacterales bacterium]|nr:hypothetical protein [Chthoniobacterales bacterium]
MRVRSGICGSTSVVAFGACILLLTGCEREDEQIKVYRVAKAPLQNPASLQTPAPSMPPNHPPVGGGTSPAAAPAVATGPSSNVPLPPHWEPQPLAQMRQASFLVRGENGTMVDISLVTLGASSGDVLANVNRWRGQLGQPAITADDLPRVVQHLPSELGHVALVDIEGTPEQGDPNKDGRIIAAIAPAESGTGFFKLRGNAALAGAEKENFLKWVSGFRK